MAKTNLPEPFLGALESLARWLAAEDVPYVMIGGVAVSRSSASSRQRDLRELFR